MSATNPSTATHDQGHGVAVIETDTFCEKCGFNLHTQRVWRDQRLDLLVCRCPECGAHSAAGKNITVTTPWLSRLTTGLMLIYVVLVVAFVIGFFFACVGVFAASDEALIFHELQTVSGQPVRYGSATNVNGTYQQIWVLADDLGTTTVPTDQVREVVRLVPWLTGSPPPNRNIYYYNYVPMWPSLIISALFAAGFLVIGVILATISWHWRKRRQFVWIAVPLIAFGLVLAITMAQEPGYSRFGGVTGADSRTLEARVFAVVLFLQLAILLFALRFGRTILRGLLLVFVPPKTRQLFAFLWYCDGKAMPAARTRHEK